MPESFLGRTGKHRRKDILICGCCYFAFEMKPSQVYLFIVPIVVCCNFSFRNLNATDTVA